MGAATLPPRVALLAGAANRAPAPTGWKVATVLLGLTLAGAALTFYRTPVEKPSAIRETSPLLPSTSEAPRADRHGDLLPPGALARLGTLRFRHPNGANALAVSRDGPIEKGPRLTDRLLFHGHHSLAVFAPDGKTLATCPSDDATAVRLLDPKSGEDRRRLDLGARLVRMAFSPDGRRLAVTERDSAVRVYDTATARREHSWTLKLTNPYENYTSVLAFSPDCNYLAAAATDNLIRLWNVTTGKEVRTFRGHGRYVTGLGFTPDGRTLFSASYDGMVRSWDVATGKERAVADGYSGEVVAACSPDGTLLATNHLDGQVRVWEVASLRVVQTFEGHRFQGRALAFSPDGLWLASGGDDGQVCVWEPWSGRAALRLAGHQGRVCGVAFAPAGRTLLTGSGDTTALLWGLRPPVSSHKPREPEALWSDLAADPEAAYRAVWALADAPATAVPLLRKRLRPVRSHSDEEMRPLLADLDSGSFQRRQAATKRLRELGRGAEPALRAALGGKPSVEKKQRIEELLAALGDPLSPSPEMFRERRAVAALAWAGTADARLLLGELARGAPAAPLTRQAQAALERPGAGPPRLP